MKATGAFTDSLWLTFNTTFILAVHMRHMNRLFFYLALSACPPLAGHLLFLKSTLTGFKKVQKFHKA